MMLVRFWSLFALLLVGVQIAQAALVNRTIDSRFGDSVTGDRATYIPSQWTDETCPDCLLRPNRSRAFRETWAETTYVPATGPVSITMRFTGVAIYIQFLLANNFGPDINTLTEFNVILDGGLPVPFLHTPGPAATFLYNQTVFSQTGLENVRHTIQVIANGDRPAYMAFDYAIYTYDDSLDAPPGGSSTGSSQPPGASSTGGSGNPGDGPIKEPGDGDDEDGATTKSSTPVGAIVGGVIGGLAFIALVIFAVLFFLRRKRSEPPAVEKGQESPVQDLTIHPYRPDPSAFGARETASFHGSGMVAPAAPYTTSEKRALVNGSSTALNAAPYGAAVVTPSQGNGSIIASSSGDGGSQRRLPLFAVNGGSSENGDAPLALHPDTKQRVPDVSGSSVSGSQAGSDSTDIAVMREQMSLMARQIEILREQRADPFETSQPPPDYQPSPTTR